MTALSSDRSDLEGRVAAVTGSATRIGLAIAREPAGRGARLVLNDLKAESLEEAAAHFQTKPARVVADISEESGAQLTSVRRRLTSRPTTPGSSPASCSLIRVEQTYNSPMPHKHQLGRDSHRLLGLDLQERRQPRLHVLAILGQMSSQRFADRRRTARLGRFDQFKMPSVRLVKCDRPGVIHESDVAVSDIHQSLRDSQPMRTHGRSDQQLMKLMMCFGIPQVAAVRSRDSEPLARTPSDSQLFVGVMPRRTPGEIHFDQQPEPVDLHQLFDAQRGHDRSAPWAQHDETVSLQTSKRLPNRDMADAHLSRQLADRKLLAGTQVARNDRALDLPDDPLHERWCGLKA